MSILLKFVTSLPITDGNCIFRHAGESVTVSTVWIVVIRAAAVRTAVRRSTHYPIFAPKCPVS